MTWPADVVLGFGALEALALVLLRRHAGLSGREIAGLLLPGAALLIALRLALGGHGAGAVAPALLAAGIFHGWDLHRRIAAARGRC